jgi:hypothetical protein
MLISKMNARKRRFVSVIAPIDRELPKDFV